MKSEATRIYNVVHLKLEAGFQFQIDNILVMGRLNWQIRTRVRIMFWKHGKFKTETQWNIETDLGSIRIET